MKNTNYLEGMRCPQCGSVEPFKIEKRTMFLVYDTDQEESDDMAPVMDDDSHCECMECYFSGAVNDFILPHRE